MWFLFVAVKIYQDSAFSAGELLAVALAHGFALFAAVSASMHVSGGHVNPAVTFGALIGGRISVLRAVYYWIAQILGAIVAALVLRLVTNNMVNYIFHFFKNSIQNILRYIKDDEYKELIIYVTCKFNRTKILFGSLIQSHFGLLIFREKKKSLTQRISVKPS